MHNEVRLLADFGSIIVLLYVAASLLKALVDWRAERRAAWLKRLPPGWFSPVSDHDLI